MPPTRKPSQVCNGTWISGDLRGCERNLPTAVFRLWALSPGFGFPTSDFFLYISFMNKFKNFVEWNAFGVCSAIGNRMGIATSKIRQYFMYTSILTMGSPIIIYMILAFWKNMRRYIKAAKRNPWYYL
jgi:phage shock protein PspC (stress-responsive transcriptional regulator)